MQGSVFQVCVVILIMVSIKRELIVFTSLSILGRKKKVKRVWGFKTFLQDWNFKLRFAASFRDVKKNSYTQNQSVFWAVSQPSNSLSALTNTRHCRKLPAAVGFRQPRYNPGSTLLPWAWPRSWHGSRSRLTSQFHQRRIRPFLPWTYFKTSLFFFFADCS